MKLAKNAVKRSQGRQSPFVVEVKVDVVVQMPAVDVGQAPEVVGPQVLRARQNWVKVAAHCADHFGSSMASRTRQPRERGQRGEEEGEEGGRQGKGEQRGEGRGKGGRGRGGNMRESVRPVQRWYAHSYRAGDHKRCSGRRIHRL